ncbi:hypothetical protein L6019_RS23495 [Escherichia coli]|nr:hypothetical protein [Escherichia coli]EKG7113518.1 hypothetical protein [Escherichia coli]EKR4920340.1 hypothetical protein [Escherichia coli]ELM8776555.1 hypothetical protein [Escherichia coli]EMA4402870.1 hypothetical protein [Escherichia coli]
MNQPSDEVLKKIHAPALSEGHANFYVLIAAYPTIASLWNWEKRELDRSRFDAALKTMSRGEIILARFFEMVWLGDNHGFDLADATYLDLKERKMIAEWLLNPIWP